MLEWIRNQIHKKYIYEIEDLKFSLRNKDDYIKELEYNQKLLISDKEKLVKDRDSLQKDLSNLQDILNRIEENYKPEGITTLSQELNYYLHFLGTSDFKITTGVQPISITNTQKDPTNEELIISSEILVSSIRTKPDLKEYASHELMVAIANDYGEWVKNKLLQESGWRI